MRGSAGKCRNYQAGLHERMFEVTSSKGTTAGRQSRRGSTLPAYTCVWKAWQKRLRTLSAALSSSSVRMLGLEKQAPSLTQVHEHLEILFGNSVSKYDFSHAQKKLHPVDHLVGA